MRISKSKIIVLFVAAFLTASPLGRAQDVGVVSPLFSLRTIDGEQALGRVIRLTREEITLFSNVDPSTVGRETVISLDDVISLERIIIDVDDPQAIEQIDPVLRRAPRLWLSNGDRFAIELIGIDEAFLTARVLSLTEAPTWKIPLELVRGYADSMRSPRARDFAGRPGGGVGPTADVISLKNGDRITGEMQGFANGEFTFETAASEVDVPINGIEAFAMNPELMEIPDVEGERALIVLTDGSFLTVRRLKTADGQWTAETTYGQAVTLPAEDLKNIMFLGRRVVMLSDLEPAAYEFTPFFSRKWDYQRDASVSGGPLIIADREYVKGIGLHSQSRLTYALGRRFSSFRAAAGIDETADERGQAWLNILVDGQPRIERLLLTGSDAAKSIAIDGLEQSDMLTIFVEFGPFGNVRDHVDLVDAVLIRQ